MPKPKVLQRLDDHIDSDNPHANMGWVTTGLDSESVEDPEPVDADTLAGHPVGYFASKTDVNLAISNYVTTVLGKSY